MSKEIRQIIDKIKNLKQSVNENVNTTTEFRFTLGRNNNSQNNVLNYRKISELLMKKIPVSLRYVDSNLIMGRTICVANISPLNDSKNNIVKYECIPQIGTKSKLHTIRNTDTINGAIQTIQRYAESIYDDRDD